MNLPPPLPPSSSSDSDDELMKLLFDSDSDSDLIDELFIRTVAVAAQLIIEDEQQSRRRLPTNRKPTNNLLKREREPELPEVEASRRAIAENCIGKKIIRSVVSDDDAYVIDGVSRSDFEASLTGKTIVGAHRKGKCLWIELDSPPFPLFQFGREGAIYIKGVDVTKYKRSAVRDTDTDEWPFECSKLFIELDNGLELSFNATRQSAKVRLLENPATVAPISELGPDAFLEPMTIDELFDALSKKKVAIKTLLLDQSFISGIGDWIADEVLYQAKIHPLQAAASIPKEACAALHMSLKEVIEHSVEVDAVSSHFPVEWLIHYRWCKKPGKINGMTIEFINAGGRTTAYVPELQKLTGDQAVKAAVKPPKKSRNKNIDEAESESEEIAKPKGGWKTTQSGAKKLPAKRKLDTSDDDDTSDDYGDLNLSDDNVEVEASHPPGRDKSKKKPSNSSSSGEDYTEHLSKLNEHIVAFKKIQQEMLELKRESSKIREERKRLFKKN
ncbi:putative DNA-(apurinic or apyrimidinic site) lyase, DNA-formamidopyrimidine glycosylase [Helianthus annuus]|uniref:Putative formamidopyrimidine-DNA glycosylase n=1 Tax=Helianthus annuus TaxID=4232 RepID=A0A251VCK0_HELAN|nr:formamidopyrimidine-DNA glycosylase isoform X1 [Helianthus annuus]KAJ0603560.1 putative DNA-(apurinic or apyrimidinic site) lyase, DNA-formamidopyrimidine glycosylase [Helianthus annuus]KAJ0613669.1 putative DNA-(apurinic or apyrimidinic site) lyase, DNA-formamidopyrimidine glycosylase [Helianthus annuus]KAJ0617477.1 putative DNA-(apurinic or apyrimidinic site) lyase, DNA-formamidopyrimidine glycosylase [Helianthus annuus]KAJ0776016.1 putative DNA-(apurinic or apyrimidinic site) lyase, DNA-f